MSLNIFSADSKIRLDSLHFLKIFLDELPLGVLVADLEGRIVYCNEAQAKIDGMPIEEIIGKLEIELYDPYAGPGIVRSCQLTNTPLLGYVCSYRTVHGKVINGAYWVYPLYDAADNVAGSLCLTQLVPTKFPIFPLSQKLSADESIVMASTWLGEKEDKDQKNAPPPIVVGTNLAFRRMMNIAETTASSPSPVLISGETGTGKEMIVKVIHRASPRRDKPYIAINCAAIPATLLEVLLFGATKGSFTGAVDRAGLFEQANGGTIYLDEIDSMPLEMQPKILRVLQDMCVRRVGSSQEIALDVKVISSIGDKPNEIIANGKLRADLFYRLAVITLRVPPLRERKDDLNELILHFINKYNKILNKEVQSVSPDVQELLHAYDWPGNVRELEHLIAGAINVAAWETTLYAHHIPEYYKNHTLQKQQIITQHNTPEQDVRQADPGVTHKGTVLGKLQQVELQAIVAAMEKTSGHITNAAKMLNISRQLLNYKLKKYGLHREQFVHRF